MNAPRPGAGRDGDQRALGGGRGHGDDIDARGQAAGNVLDDEQGKQKRKRKDQPLKLVCTICSEEHYTNQCPQL